MQQQIHPMFGSVVVGKIASFFFKVIYIEIYLYIIHCCAQNEINDSRTQWVFLFVCFSFFSNCN